MPAKNGISNQRKHGLRQQERVIDSALNKASLAALEGAILVHEPDQEKVTLYVPLKGFPKVQEAPNKNFDIIFDVRQTHVWDGEREEMKMVGVLELPDAFAQPIKRAVENNKVRGAKLVKARTDEMPDDAFARMFASHGAAR